MTVIELYDRYDPVNNMVAVLGLQPDRVIFVGARRWITSPKRQSLLICGVKAVSPGTAVEFCPVNPYDIESCCAAISEIVDLYGADNCVADLTGGQDVMLFAAGVLCERSHIRAFVYRPGLHALRCVNRADAPLIPIQVQPSFIQLLAAAGGAFIRYGRSDRSDMIEMAATKAAAVLRYINADTTAWQSFVLYFQQASKLLYKAGSRYNAPSQLRSGSRTVFCPPKVFSFLRDLGLIRHFAMNLNVCEFELVHDGIRAMLTDPGIWLELYVYNIIRSTALFDSVETSVVVRWDNDDDPTNDVENEIDVLAVRGMGQLFVSCKINSPDQYALFELSAITHRFGSHYALGLLVTPQDLHAKAPSLLLRAEQMGIIVVCGEDLAQDKLTTIFSNISKRWGRVSSIE